MNNAELTLREIILKISEWVHHLLSKWKVILLSAVLGATLGIVYSVISIPKYVAELTFVLEGDDRSSGALGMYTGIAQQFGLDLGRSGTGSVFSDQNFEGLLQSRLLVERVLLSPLDSGSNKQSLADYYLDTHDKEWEGKDGNTIRFPSSQFRDSLSLEQSRVLKRLYAIILEDHLVVEKVEKTSFIMVKCSSLDEMFSKLFVERLMSEAVDFYTATKTKRARESIAKLQKKADSLESVLNERTYAVASTQDLNRNPARQIATVDVELAMRDKQLLQGIYIEVMKNLEVSKLSLLKETPLIQIIDRPILPLRKESPGMLGWGIGGAILAVLLSTIILLGLYIYKEIMRA